MSHHQQASFQVAKQIQSIYMAACLVFLRQLETGEAHPKDTVAEITATKKILETSLRHIYDQSRQQINVALDSDDVIYDDRIGSCSLCPLEVEDIDTSLEKQMDTLLIKKQAKINQLKAIIETTRKSLDNKLSYEYNIFQNKIHQYCTTATSSYDNKAIEDNNENNRNDNNEENKNKNDTVKDSNINKRLNNNINMNTPQKKPRINTKEYYRTQKNKSRHEYDHQSLVQLTSEAKQIQDKLNYSINKANQLISKTDTHITATHNVTRTLKFTSNKSNGPI